MDKLKPLITHKFWIILFIALILPVVGWSMATGSLAKEIDERKTAIDKAFTDAQIQPNPPNDTWSSALREINKQKENYIGTSKKFVWEKQKELFVWPPSIQAELDKQKTPYRGTINNVALNLYRSAYKFEVMRAHKVVNPFDMREGTGTVDLKVQVLPHVPLSKWQTLPPTSEEMWNAQEDIWLTTSILEAIAKVNKGAANISEAPVRQITVLQLRGGTPGDDGSAPAGGGMEGMEGMDPEMMAGGGGMFGGGSGGSGGGGMTAGMEGGKAGGISVDVDMDLVKIFGNDVDGSAGGGDGGMSGEMPAEDMGMVGGLGGGSGGMGGSQNLKRYYNEEEELPYKTRAFYLKATIQSSKLPDLLASLSSMPWPTKIVRVQRASMFDDNMSPIVSNTGGGAMRGGMGGSGGAESFNADSGFGGNDFGPAAGGAGGFGFEAETGGISGGLQPGAENRSLLDAALNDPELAVVTVAGLMTLYKPYVPPEGSEEAAQNDGNQQPAGQPGENPDGQQADPAATADTPATETPAAPGASQPAANGQETPGTTPGQPATPPAAQPGSNPAEPGANTNSPPAGQPAAGTQPDTNQPPQNATPSEPAGNQ
ncbi:hypothetical protein Enr10x_21640 [Gimesia panareensis]|uniref:Uncharacterized protein n=1 Tax=Gimesia panareensis TaxID=2527978 RepID=A0A517Q5E0_9PLAN|nr:hypothetical protein [Gimesia panareensis]QDT26853.1 hypothetical protein Enr10x_21640 [Gimesia panareensis]